MLKVGIFGAGFIAQAHAYAYALQPHARLAVIADPRRERAEELASTYGATAVGSVEELLASDVDAVSICTPTPTHADIAIAAMRAGKHVLCEKPVARSVEQADAMIEAARTHNVKFMVGHVSRYEVDHRRSKQIVERGDLGTLRMAYQAITGPFPEWSSGGWFADEQKSGGPVLDLAIHSFDYLLWMFGSPAVRVSAVGARGKLNLHSYALVTIAFRDGGLGLVETSWAHPKAQGLTVRTELSGTLGRMHWTYDDIAALEVVTEHAPKRTAVMLGENSFRDEVADFVRCVVDDLPAPISGKEARDALHVALAALHSLESGQTVAL
jgi:predicted dehydrogenase